MITKDPVNSDAFKKNLLFTNSARTGWKHLLQNLSFAEGEFILIPAYIGFTEREGSGVFDPIKETKTPYLFYSLNDQLSIDISNLERIIKSNNIKLLLVIHYFGIKQVDIEKIKKLCISESIILVEDCAHSYNINIKGYDLGSHGDFSFYSLHKYFPVKSGGLLRINSPDFNISTISNGERCEKEVLTTILSSDVEGIAQKRIENYRYLMNCLNDGDGYSIMYSLDEGIIPHDFPIRVHSGLREKVYFALMDRNIPTIALYYRLIDEIDENEFPRSFEVSNSILNLPVHQDIEISDLDNVVRALGEVIQNLRE